MATAKPFAFAVVAALAVGAYGQDSAKARDLLRRSMGRTFAVNVVSIITQLDPSGDGTYQRVKVERSADGKTHHTVLQPLRLQGIETIDDGDRSYVYLPDDKLVIDQPSGLREASDVDFRINLAARNYRIRLDGRTRIAGRNAVVVTAVPRAGELETRRFYIDEATSYPLRMETVSNGEVSVIYDTKDIQYPRSIDPEVFRMRPLGKVGTIRYNRPSSYSSPASVRAALGFTPVMPEELPMGFRVQEMQSTQNPKWRAVVVRMTDGLVRATLYQWRGSDQGVNVKSFMDRTMREVNGVRLLLVSDLGPRERERLMDAFVTRSEATPVAVIAGIAPPPSDVGPK